MTTIRKAVFPVAGFGTRFLPATKAMPKELLPIVDKPLIQYAAEEAIAAGIDPLILIHVIVLATIFEYLARAVAKNERPRFILDYALPRYAATCGGACLGDVQFPTHFDRTIHTRAECVPSVRGPRSSGFRVVAEGLHQSPEARL